MYMFLPCMHLTVAQRMLEHLERWSCVFGCVRVSQLLIYSLRFLTRVGTDMDRVTLVARVRSSRAKPLRSYERKYFVH